MSITGHYYTEFMARRQLEHLLKSLARKRERHPAVVGVQEATRRIRNGQHVRVTALQVQ